MFLGSMIYLYPDVISGQDLPITGGLAAARAFAALLLKLRRPAVARLCHAPAMADPVAVTCEPIRGGWTCHVTVGGPGATTSHEVAVSAADLERLAPGAAGPEDLVARSFAFLLAREPKTSILRRFELPLIGRYFPEYEREIHVTG